MHRSENVGAIVMNCNPFTSGHRYLIETAADKHGISALSYLIHIFAFFHSLSYLSRCVNILVQKQDLYGGNILCV